MSDLVPWWKRQTQAIDDKDRGYIVPLATDRASGREVLALPGFLKSGVDGAFTLTDKYLSGNSAEYSQDDAANALLATGLMSAAGMGMTRPANALGMASARSKIPPDQLRKLVDEGATLYDIAQKSGIAGTRNVWQPMRVAEEELIREGIKVPAKKWSHKDILNGTAGAPPMGQPQQMPDSALVEQMLSDMFNEPDGQTDDNIAKIEALARQYRVRAPWEQGQQQQQPPMPPEYGAPRPMPPQTMQLDPMMSRGLAGPGAMPMQQPTNALGRR